MLYSFEMDMVHGFIIGLALPLRLVLEYLIVAGHSISQVVDYLRSHAISIVLLVSHLKVKIFSMEVSFICNLSILPR